MWKELRQLKDTFNDAENYKTRQQKDFFNQLFLRTEDLYRCLDPAIYYLLGEKGSGKTAYATYLDNNTINETQCKLTTMTESQYKRFIALKRQGKLEYSDYENIWRPMLLSMLAQVLVQRCKSFLGNITGKFTAIEELIATFDDASLNPEVEVAFRVVSESKDKVGIGVEKVASLTFEDSTQRTDEIEIIRHHLLRKESELKQAIADLKLGKDVVLFIDGIDYRPESVPYADYLACIKGLGEAAWHLNSDYLGNIRDSRGRMKIVLLLRPDVFHSMNIYNSNSRLRDNSVLLDWATTEKEMAQSRLYSAAGRYFSSQQEVPIDDMNPVEAANWYFSADKGETVFRRFLRISFQKPRDVLTFIQTARDVAINRLGKGAENQLPPEVLSHPVFTKEYAAYLLGEVKNYAAFYMEQGDFSTYLKFFQYLNGKSEFTYTQFREAFVRFKKWVNGEPLQATSYLRDPEALLQFFYDVNVIGYTEAMEGRNEGNGPSSNMFVHWAFRERTLSDIAPKVKMSGMLKVNPGISKALDIGLQAQQRLGGQHPEHKRAAKFARPHRSRQGKLQGDGPSEKKRPSKEKNHSRTSHHLSPRAADANQPNKDGKLGSDQLRGRGAEKRKAGQSQTAIGARARFKP